MNTGAEAVETAIKTARKWGYEVKGVTPGRATIIVCDGNFHGRTTTIVSFSDDPLARDGFGPVHARLRQRPVRRRASAGARAARQRRRRRVPRRAGAGRGRRHRSARRLAARRRAACARAHGVLLIADEIQSGPRPHRAHVRLRPRGRRARRLRPRQGARRRHPRAVGDRRRRRRARRLRARARTARRSAATRSPARSAAPCSTCCAAASRRPTPRASARAARRTRRRRARGAATTSARAACGSASTSRPAGRARAPPASSCWTHGVLAKDTHERTVRLAPPLTITAAEADWLLERLVGVLGSPRAAARPRRAPACFGA